MRTTLRILTPLFAAAGAAAAIMVAPAASAQPAPEPAPAPAPTEEQRPQASSLLPQCVNEGGSAALGGSSTECATPGNVQINDTPAQQEYVGPWGDMWGEPGLFFP
ncbi:hypothetical protein [Mycolicibacterium gadium]|jgi:hypothetical protein|uniref:Uncharacterized protein n=1 Tax=Mycolicibacterium gadium TaxID=1794 RepID=A0ABT6GP23_MYCGU|nr:hypothetical protein [Mycolicibacterium gadium]MDG5482796.1 hypothetical protein [Mycolicibacterium gadium]